MLRGKFRRIPLNTNSTRQCFNFDRSTWTKPLGPSTRLYPRKIRILCPDTQQYLPNKIYILNFHSGKPQHLVRDLLRLACPTANFCGRFYSAVQSHLYIYVIGLAIYFVICSILQEQYFFAVISCGCIYLLSITGKAELEILVSNDDCHD